MEYVSEFGTLLVGRFDGRFRRDTWISARTGERFAEPAFAAGPEDKSNRHNHSIGQGYDPRCSCCYLNFTHTQELHNRRIGQ